MSKVIEFLNKLIDEKETILIMQRDIYERTPNAATQVQAAISVARLEIELNILKRFKQLIEWKI